MVSELGLLTAQTTSLECTKPPCGTLLRLNMHADSYPHGKRRGRVCSRGFADVEDGSLAALHWRSETWAGPRTGPTSRLQTAPAAHSSSRTRPRALPRHWAQNTCRGWIAGQKLKENARSGRGQLVSAHLAGTCIQWLKRRETPSWPGEGRSSMRTNTRKDCSACTWRGPQASGRASVLVSALPERCCLLTAARWRRTTPRRSRG